MRGIRAALPERPCKAGRPMNAGGPGITKIQQALSEIVLVLLGVLLVFLGTSGMFWVQRRSAAWIGVGILIIYRGVRLFVAAPSGANRTLTRWEEYVRGGSLLVVGAIMLGTAGLPPSYAGPLLGTAGAILVLRGLANAALALRPR
jgi:uncharacterized membrane protein